MQFYKIECQSAYKPGSVKALQAELMQPFFWDAVYTERLKQPTRMTSLETADTKR